MSISGFINSAYTWAFRTNSRVVPATQNTITIKAIEVLSTANQELMRLIDATALDAKVMNYQIDNLTKAVKLPKSIITLEDAFKALSKITINLVPKHHSGPVEHMPSAAKHLPLFRKDNSVFNHFHFGNLYEAENQANIKKYQALYTKFYTCVALFEKNFKRLDLSQLKIKDLMLFLFCDGFDEHKFLIASQAKEKILHVNEGKFPLNSFGYSKEHFLLYQGYLDALLNNCKDMTKEEISKLYTYEHPTVLLERKNKPSQLSENEHQVYIYNTFLNYKDSFLKFWLAHDKFGENSRLLKDFIKQAESNNPQLSGLNAKIQSLGL